MSETEDSEENASSEEECCFLCGDNLFLLNPYRCALCQQPVCEWCFNEEFIAVWDYPDMAEKCEYDSDAFLCTECFTIERENMSL